MKVSALLTICILSIVFFGSLTASSNGKDSASVANPSKGAKGGKSSKKDDDEDESDNGSADDESSNSGAASKVVKKSKATANSSSSSISLGFAFVAILAAVSML
ncbi:hypothetical protein NEIG_00465 [Nematocida sp. ERTm5]|nr:hypothetical protein NEIRO02_0211 [Nematocida sp. AWRm79]KAI5182546.1 hypothetical protein NEIRO03_0210 [Nematocida sp. AWRm78]OAG30302.1 hypothetical protein NEIG_00465 [Nematocida sp. ERTm5]